MHLQHLLGLGVKGTLYWTPRSRPYAISAEYLGSWCLNSRDEATAAAPDRQKAEEDRMKRRFSAQELYELRNLIPIDLLIKNQLVIPIRKSEGLFRFLCPLCGGFQTATNPKTNLARCFGCKENFNTIDMVMLCRKIDFVESVRFLKNLAEKKGLL